MSWYNTSPLLTYYRSAITRVLFLDISSRFHLTLWPPLNTSCKALDTCGTCSRSGSSEDQFTRGASPCCGSCVRADYRKDYFESGDPLQDGEKGREYVRANKERFDYCYNQLDFLCWKHYVRIMEKVVKDMPNEKAVLMGAR